MRGDVADRRIRELHGDIVKSNVEVRIDIAAASEHVEPAAGFLVGGDVKVFTQLAARVRVRIGVRVRRRQRTFIDVLVADETRDKGGAGDVTELLFLDQLIELALRELCDRRGQIDRQGRGGRVAVFVGQRIGEAVCTAGRI